MADDSWDIEVNMDFHPCDRPHGMKDYILSDITPEQQLQLNERKKEEIRSDHKYLAEHPEVRGIIIMLLRLVLKERPKYDIHETIGRYFVKPCVDIQEEVILYLKEREQILAVPSFVMVKPEEVIPVVSSTDEQLLLEKASEKEEISELEALEEESVVKEEGEEGEEVEEVVHVYEKPDSTEIICQHILNEILDNVIEEIDIPSLESFISAGVFEPVDYDDHALGSPSSSIVSSLVSSQLDEPD